MIEGLQPGFILLNAVDELPDEPPPDDGWDAQTHGEPWQLADSQLLDLLRDAQRTAAAAHAQWLALLAEAERRNATLQATALPTASWLAIHNSHTARTARAEVLLATRVAECAPVAQAYAQGALSTEQAATIVHGLDRLPDSLPAADRDEVARQLVEWAGDFNPAGLRRLVDHAVSVVDPEVADAADAAALERLERQQQRDRHLSWRRDHDGCILLAGKLPPVAGEAVIGHLTALAARQRAVDALSGLETSPGQAAADALVQLVTHHARCQGAPRAAGSRSGWSSPWAWSSWLVVWGRRRSSAPAKRSAPARPVGSHATPAFCRWSWAGPANRWTSAANSASSPTHNERPWRSGTAAAPSPPATAHRPTARPTMCGPGGTAANPTSRTGSCSARTITT